MSEQQYDLAVVGGGMVGATLAALIAQSLCAEKQSPQQPLRIAVIENAPPQAVSNEQNYTPRVSAITVASERVFRYLNLWQHFEAIRVSPFRKMDVWDADGTGSIQFYGHEIGLDHLGNIVENAVIQRALYDRLQQLQSESDALTLHCPATVNHIERLEQGDWRLHLDSGEALNTSLLIAADGAQSRIREWVGFETREWDYGHRGIVTTLKTEKPHGEVARQRFMTTGPLALLPLHGEGELSQRLCSIVWSAEDALAEKLLNMSEAEFCKALEEASEGVLGDIQLMDRRYAFPLRQRHATHYVKDNVVLIGDAAHTIHPLAGQGVNLGIMDAAQLAETILQARQKSLPISHPMMLRRFERHRKGDNLTMMSAMEGFKQLFGAKPLPLRLIRNRGLSWMNQAKPIKNAIMQRAMGTKGDLPVFARAPVAEELPY